MASRWIIGVLTAAAVTIVPATAAAAPPFVTVDAKLVRIPGGAVVKGKVVWDQAAATTAPDYMSVGDVRLVAVSDHGHRPTLLLPTLRWDRIAEEPIQPIDLRIPAAKLHAIRPGNRVVLTASQHGVLSGARTARTYVTVGQLQPFGSAQPGRLGRRDCSGEPIVPGAQLDGCDLVGSFLDRALVSERRNATRMLRADLTGGTMSGADLSGLSVAGGRLNGADATRAVLDNVSLAGAEATGLIADHAVSDRLKGTAGANLFDTRLTDAVFTDALLNGVSLDGSRLNGANFHGATWSAVTAETTNFRGADLGGLKGVDADVYMADFTDANLQGAFLSPTDLEWATLCRTIMPPPPTTLSNRDCREGIDPGPTPVANPYVSISGSLQRQPGRAEIQATVTWNAAGIGSLRMSAGDIRVVAIDGSTGLPTTVAKVSIPSGLPATTPCCDAITDTRLLAAMNSGNRVVITATQHEPLPSRVSSLTTRSYVKVLTLQPGPGRGRVGSRDCSNLALSPSPPAPAPLAPDSYNFCDLPGAVLTQASLSGSMREADLTGTELGNARLSGMFFDGAAMAGAVTSGADFKGVRMINTFAPALKMRRTIVSGAKLTAARLDEADFEASKIASTSFATASLRRATFSDATFDSVDLAFARLPDAKLDGVDATKSPSSLFLANLTGATLKDSQWAKDESDAIPWTRSTLCQTTLPDGTQSDLDCPR